jgi:hypothetical protein
MYTRSYRPFCGHYALRLAAASLMSFMVTACGAQHYAGDRTALRPARERTLAFENSTTEPVSVFLEERGSRWFVGYVLPGGRADLRLPSATSLAGREFTLVVVPASARRGVPTRSSVAFPGPITADQLRGEYLTNVQWRLTGRWLVPVPIPSRP